MNDNGTIDPADTQIKDEIKNTIKNREGTYKSALVITTLSKAQDSWRNVFTNLNSDNLGNNY